MSFETIKFVLAAAAAAGLLWLAARRLGRFLSWIERSEIDRQKAEAAKEAALKKTAATAVVSAQPDGVPADHIAVIAAAVAACGYRVVHIADAPTGNAWAAEGRWMHQTSHRTH